jgi:hypothetical protein
MLNCHVLNVTLECYICAIIKVSHVAYVESHMLQKSCFNSSMSMFHMLYMSHEMMIFLNQTC